MALPAFAKARVLVAGDVMLDRYWSGGTHRISPEAPVPVVRVTADEARPGGAANVALNIAALGAAATVLGVTGDDADGRALQAALHAAGIAAPLLPGSAPTITKLRVLSRHQQLIRLDFEQRLDATGAFDRTRFCADFAAVLPTAQAVVLSDYGKGTLCDVRAHIAAARTAHKPVLLDPKGSDWSCYAGATLITPNLAEFEAVAGAAADDATLVAKALRLIADLQLSALLITRSERGMTLVQPGAPALHLPTEAREVFDVTGAGDTVIATLAAALAAGATLADAARLSNTAAGIVVGKLGTATATAAELEHAQGGGHERRVFGEDALMAWARARQARGQRLVMTNGCFDLLHAGHVRYLEAARALGDALIVAVNSDASVQRLKGESRPLNALPERLEMLAALRCVDAVVAFGEDTPARLIGRVLPALLVKGGDYRPENIAGFDAVTAAGGNVLALDFHAGYSTTRLIERARGV